MKQVIRQVRGDHHYSPPSLNGWIHSMGRSLLSGYSIYWMMSCHWATAQPIHHSEGIIKNSESPQCREQILASAQRIGG